MIRRNDFLDDDGMQKLRGWRLVLYWAALWFASWAVFSGLLWMLVASIGKQPWAGQ